MQPKAGHTHEDFKPDFGSNLHTQVISQVWPNSRLDAFDYNDKHWLCPGLFENHVVCPKSNTQAILYYVANIDQMNNIDQRRLNFSLLLAGYIQ